LAEACGDQLHILLGHRLFPQSGGFERLGAVVEDVGATDLSVLDVIDACQRRFVLRSLGSRR